MTKKIFKVGDPVKKYYWHLKGYGKTVHCIISINFDNPKDPVCVLAQEHFMVSHYSLGNMSELKFSKFTKNKDRDFHKIRDRCIRDSK